MMGCGSCVHCLFDSHPLISHSQFECRRVDPYVSRDDLVSSNPPFVFQRIFIDLGSPQPLTNFLSRYRRFETRAEQFQKRLFPLDVSTRPREIPELIKVILIHGSTRTELLPPDYLADFFSEDVSILTASIQAHMDAQRRYDDVCAMEDEENEEDNAPKSAEVLRALSAQIRAYTASKSK